MSKKKKWKGSDHYREGGIEVLDVMEAKMTEEQLDGFYLGCAIKYLLRLNFIPTSEKVTDLKKTIHYCQLLLERVE